MPRALKRHVPACDDRWDACFIRLLDGLLQAGALNSPDTQLRVPTGIRRLLIKDPSPAAIAGSEGQRLYLSIATSLLPASFSERKEIGFERSV